MITSREIGLLIPSMGRPVEALLALASAYRKPMPNGVLDAVVVLDRQEDWQPYLDAGIKELDLMTVPNTESHGFVSPVNLAAAAFVRVNPLPKYIGFMGDDHRIRTDGAWWNLVLDRNEAFVYGDDLLQGINLPTAVFIRGDVVAALGYFAPPVLQHLYADNAWLELGRASGSIHYEPRLVIEHMHPAAGKGDYDALKAELNDSPIRNRDERAFNEWRSSSAFTNDVEVIKKCIGAS